MYSSNNRNDKPADNPLLSKAQEYTSGRFGVIPVDSDKKPVLGKGEVESKRGRIATFEELIQYFGYYNSDNDKTRNPRTVGIALLINETEFTIDTDGRGEWVFQNRIMPRFSPALQKKINSTMCTKTPHGYHRIFRYKPSNSDDVIKDRTYWNLEGEHDEIAVKGKDHYSVECGPGYQEIRGLDYLSELSKDEITELLRELSLFRLEKNAAENVVRILKDYYKEPKRNNLTFAIAGFLHKGKVTEEIIMDIIERLVIAVNDEELESRLQVVSNTCAKDPDSGDVSGYERLLEELDGNYDAIKKIKDLFNKLGYGYFPNGKKKSGRDDRAEDEREDASPSTKDQLALELVEENLEQLFTDQFDDAYAAVKVDKHVETLRIKSSRFANWIARLHYTNTKEVLGSENIKNIKAVLEARAVFDGEQRKLHLRVGSLTDVTTGQGQINTIYYDLANKDWSVVKITDIDWQIKHSPNSLFRRYSSTGMQVDPSKDYPADIFDQFINLVNVKDEEQKLLLKCYIISLFFPEIPKPIQMLYGEQGAAKTSEQEAIKDLVDPSPIPTATFPRDINELVQKMMHSYICYFDNISFIPPWISDQLCRAVTGSGFSKRELYSDDNDIIYNFRRCIGFNGINLAATKADLLDRGLIMRLDRIPESERLRDTVVKAKFASLKPQLLGYIFDILVKVLQVKKNGGIDIKGYPRMADFAETGEIISRCMGYEENKFLDAYYKNINILTEEAIEAHPVATAIVIFMTDKTSWNGTITELYTELEKTATDSMIDTFGKIWPKAPNSLSRRLNEVKTNLRAKGITIEGYLADTSTGLRGIRICKISSESSDRQISKNYEENTVKNSDGIIVEAGKISSESNKISSEKPRENHEEIAKDLHNSDGSGGSDGILHISNSHPKSEREGIYWAGSNWYCQYCRTSGDRFFMEKHICTKSKVKNTVRKERIEVPNSKR